MSAHTQGPWSSRGTLGPRHAEHLKGPCVVEVAATGKQLAILSGWRTETQHADARLMAAAPELLKALQAAVERASEMATMTDDEFRAARAAIAKATGETA